MSGLNGVSPPIGGFTLEAGGCFTQAVTIAGVTLTGMTVTCSPRTPPPNGVTWEGYASNPERSDAQNLHVDCRFHSRVDLRHQRRGRRKRADGFPGSRGRGEFHRADRRSLFQSGCDPGDRGLRSQ